MAISELIQETIAQHIANPKVISYAPTKLNEVQGRFVSSNRVYNFVLNKSGVSYSPAGQGDSLLFSGLYLERFDAARKPKIGNDRCNAGKSYQCGKICLGNRRKCHKGVRDVNDARRIASILASTNEKLKGSLEGSDKAIAKGKALFEARGNRAGNPKAARVKPDDTDALNRLEQLVELGKKPTEQKVDIKKPMPLAEVKDIYKRLRDGDITANELHQQWDRLSANLPSLEAEMKKMKKADLLKLAGYHARSSDSKDSLAKSALSNATGLFNIKGSVSYTMGEGSYEKALDKLVKATTDKDIQSYAAEHKKASEERSAEIKRIKDGIENPKTTEDFKNIVRYKHGGDESKLTDEHKEQYDEALAKEGKEKRFKQTAKKAEVAAASVPDNLGMKYEKGKHSKTGEDLHVVKMSDRVSKEAYVGLKDRAKGLDGYYSSFVKGFIFKTEENAQKFAKNERVKGEDVVAAKQETKQNSAATRIKDLADRLMESADESLNRDRLANTHRRARMASNAEYEATKNKQLAESMLNVSQAIEDGNTKFLDRMSTKADFVQMEELLSSSKYNAYRAIGSANFKKERGDVSEVDAIASDVKYIDYPHPWVRGEDFKKFIAKTEKIAGLKNLSRDVDYIISSQMSKEPSKSPTFIRPDQVEKLRDYISAVKKKGNLDKYEMWSLEHAVDKLQNYDRLQRMGITNDAELRAAAREYLTYRGKRGQSDPVKALEREIIGQKFEGYFPTPKGLADHVAETADIKPNMRVLEPSAGKGSLADAALQYLNGDKSTITTIEPVSALQNILKVKGYNVSDDRDFMEHKGEYDRIIMNPPFEGMQDADHVKHAYSLLAKGGKLVAITGESPFFRSDRKAVEFRDWLDSVGGSSEKLPEGSFKDSDRSTGVNTRLVVITKPVDTLKAKSVKDIVNGDLTKLSDSELEDLHKMRTKEFDLGDPEGEKIRDAINQVQRRRADPAKYEKDVRETNQRKAAIEAERIQRAKELDPKALAKLPKNKESIGMHFEALANKFKGANLRQTTQGLTHGVFNKDDQESLNVVKKALDDAEIKYTGGWTGSNSNNSYQISISTRDENLKKVRSFLTKP